MIIAAHLFLGLIALFWLGVLVRVAREKERPEWRVGAEDPPPDRPVRVTLIIPARDEAQNIGPCLDAVLAQDLPGLRIVVLDDGSTDGTSEILAGYAARGVEVIRGDGGALPAGWMGKPWACQRASRHALLDAPEWLLFIDADVRLHPRAVSAALGYAIRQDLAMLSGFGTLIMEGFWEQVLQPMVAGLILAGNPIDRVNDPARRRGKPLANGQFLLFRRDAYEAVGGHEAVAHNVVDDVGLATAVTERGYAYHMVFMRSLFTCRMYDSFGALWNGWSKNLFVGMGARWSALVGLSVFLFLYMVFPWLLLLAGALGWVGPVWTAWGAGLVVIMHLARAVLDRTFDRPLRWGLSHPLGAALMIALFWSSALRTVRGTATWKGRTLARPGA